MKRWPDPIHAQFLMLLAHEHSLPANYRQRSRRQLRQMAREMVRAGKAAA